MFDKTKKFIKEHSKAIQFTGMIITGAAIGAVAYYCGAKSVIKSVAPNDAMKNIVDVLEDIPNGAKVRVFGGIYNPGIAAKELGELGVEMVKKGADESADLFTHFIAIEKLNA